MAVPKRKTSKSKKNSRRAHHALEKPNLRPCPSCGAYGIPHRVCIECGMYKSRQIVMPKIKTSKDKSAEA